MVICTSNAFIRDVIIRLVQFDWKKSFKNPLKKNHRLNFLPGRPHLSGCGLQGRRLDRLESQSDHHATDKHKGALVIWAESAWECGAWRWLIGLSVCLSVWLLRVTTPAAQKAATTMTSCWRHLETTWAWVSSPCSAASARWVLLPFTWQMWWGHIRTWPGHLNPIDCTPNLCKPSPYIRYERRWTSWPRNGRSQSGWCFYASRTCWFPRQHIPHRQ